MRLSDVRNTELHQAQDMTEEYKARPELEPEMADI
jgi:hypothetical protein